MPLPDSVGFAVLTFHLKWKLVCSLKGIWFLDPFHISYPLVMADLHIFSFDSLIICQPVEILGHA